MEMKPTPDQITRAIEMKMDGYSLVQIRDSLCMTEGQVNRAWRDYRKENPNVPTRPTKQPIKKL